MATSKNSRAKNTPTQLTFFPAASHANPSASQESAKERRTPAIYGRKIIASFEQFDRPSMSAKMFVACLIGTMDWSSNRCKLIWKISATKSHRLFFLLLAKTPRTDVTAFGLLPTPTSMQPGGDLEKIDNRRAAAKEKHGNNGFGMPLSEMALRGLLPTPRASDWKGAPSTEETLKKRQEESTRGVGLEEHLTRIHGGSFRLHPQFVEQMMGFPIGWTDLNV